MPETPVLCYIQRNFAYFTTQPLPLQQGSGWHKTAYEYNAGPPTAPRAGETWRILRIAYDCARLATPGEQAGMNSPYSVAMINAREVPWPLQSRNAERGMRNVSSDDATRLG
jgi:hypothetical protein